MTKAHIVDSCLDCPLVAFGKGDEMYCQHPGAPDSDIDVPGEDVAPWCPMRSEDFWLCLRGRERKSREQKKDRGDDKSST